TWSQGEFQDVNLELGTSTTASISPQPAGANDDKRLVRSSLANSGTLTSTGYVVLDAGEVVNFGTMNLRSGWRFDCADMPDMLPNTNRVAEINNFGVLDVQAQGKFGFENDVLNRMALLTNSPPPGPNPPPGGFRVSAGDGADVDWDFETSAVTEL